ncbi:MAG: HlyD family secretion protein [Alphaproteobacteria bacterium]|nr:HlyD family secretion protein [Alphaproteobacteria bacterium]MBV9692945.1 HlyD family secretion protein [Alphaproteobacteria bacterium]
MRPSVLALVLMLLAGCGRQGTEPWLGYAEGDSALIAAPQAGWVSDLRVERGSVVKTGDLLFRLDDTAQTAARDQASAQIAQAEGQLGQARATLDLAAKQLARQRGLLRSGATSKQALDQAQSAYDAARAALAQIAGTEQQARATLSGATYQLSQRDVIARTSGIVQDIYFRPGEYVAAMTPVVSVLPPANIYVRFFVPETQFARVKLGQRVRIHCDGCATDLTATVTFIAAQQEFTPPVIFSVGNREKLVFKVEARVPGGLKLHPGQPVDVSAL